VICGPDGVPRQFHWQGHAQQVARSWGPERIETGWWRGRAAGRDYYRVETAAGHRFWLFARLRDGRWFLHGMFE
jgi:protein ImuB